MVAERVALSSLGLVENESGQRQGETEHALLLSSGELAMACGLDGAMATEPYCGSWARRRSTRVGPERLMA